MNKLSPSVFNTWFDFSSDQHSYETSISTQGSLIKLFCKTNRCGKYLITISAIESWDKIKKQLKNTLLKDLSPIKLKQLSVIFILNYINNFIDPTKTYMTLLVPKIFQSNYSRY